MSIDGGVLKKQAAMLVAPVLGIALPAGCRNGTRGGVAGKGFSNQGTIGQAGATGRNARETGFFR